MPRLITLGETMVAFTPNNMGALRYVSDYRMRIAGAESNLAIGVAKLGESVGWISRLGDDEFGQFTLNSVRAEGVDTSGVSFDPDHPTGVMFKETSVNETKVYYYRSQSAASFLSPSDLNPDDFKQAEILHITGITPVLSKSCFETVHAAIKLAKENGLRISFDPNIRKKLWKDTDYTLQIREITLQSEIVLLGLDEAATLFGTQDITELCNILFTQGCAQAVAIKNGAKGAVVATPTECVSIPPQPCTCIDPIGAGDGFNAAFLTGMLQGKDITTCGKMGAIAGALATQTTGDVEGYPSKAQMEQLLLGLEEVYR